MNKYSQQQIERIAHKVIDLMKTEKENWFKPFSSFTYSADKKTFLTNQPFNAVSGNNYSGYNVIELSLSSLLYSNNAWVTFKQAQQLGGSVLKGEQGHPVCYYGVARSKEDTTTTAGLITEKSYAFLKWYKVFNIDQTTLDAKSIIGDTLLKNKNEAESNLKKFGERKIKTNAELDLFVQNTSAKIIHAQAGRCFYVPSKDFINMSPLDTWKGNEEVSAEDFYYSVLFHELTHWTGHETRLNRKDSNPYKENGYKKSYAFEELVAELGSAITASVLGITKTPMANHAQYLSSWVEAIEDKPAILMKASAQAGQAFTLLASLQQSQSESEEAAA